MMPAIDRHVTLPAVWTGEVVKARLVEAFETERKLPKERLLQVMNAWPATPVHGFEDMLGWEDSRERVWNDWSNTKSAYSFEISRMEESMLWLLWISDGERRCLASWALMTAIGRSVRHMLQRKHWSRTTYYRRVDQGSERIADRLIREGVKVR
jgi:hypothetical protein